MNLSSKIIPTLIMGLILTSCSDTNTMTKGAEFYSMTGCLESIKRVAKSPTLKIVTDNPSNVSGFLRNGKHFACEKRVSGTKGIYYYGYFVVDQ